MGRLDEYDYDTDDYGFDDVEAAQEAEWSEEAPDEPESNDSNEFALDDDWLKNGAETSWEAHEQHVLFHGPAEVEYVRNKNYDAYHADAGWQRYLSRKRKADKLAQDPEMEMLRRRQAQQKWYWSDPEANRAKRRAIVARNRANYTEEQHEERRRRDREAKKLKRQYAKAYKDFS